MNKYFLLAINFICLTLTTHTVFADIDLPYLQLHVFNKLDKAEKIKIEIKPAHYFTRVWNGACSDTVDWKESKVVCNIDNKGIPALPQMYHDPNNSIVVERNNTYFDGEIIISSENEQLADIHYSMNYYLPSPLKRPDQFLIQASRHDMYIEFGVPGSYLQWDDLKIVSQDPHVNILITDTYTGGINWCYVKSVRDSILTSARLLFDECSAIPNIILTTSVSPS